MIEGISAAPSSSPTSACENDPPAVDLTVVIPVFNEAHRIGDTVEQVGAWLSGRIEAGKISRAEIIVVSDGSIDGPSARLPSAEREGVSTRLIEFPENRGKGAAVRAGILAARGARVLFSDADLATPIEEAARLEEAIAAGADIAIASRRVADSDVQVEQSFARRLTGGLFPRVVRLLTGLRFGDTQCGFKMFRREAARVLFADLREQRFAFDVELLCAAREQAFRVAEIGVVWRDSGETTLRLLRDPLRMGTTLLRLADPQRFPRVFARQLGIAALLTLALLAFARGAFSGTVPFFASAPSAPSVENLFESGDWLIPAQKIDGVWAPILGRAPLADWAIAASQQVFGPSPFATRLPSYLCGLLLLALVFRAARCFGQRDLGALAALILASSLLFLAMWGVEITDLTATLALAGVWLSAVIAATPGSAHPWLWRYGVFGFLGLALLSVGPLALPLAVLPILAGRPRRESGDRDSRAGVPWGRGGVLAAAIALPWFLAVEGRHPGAWRAFFAGDGGASLGSVWLTWAVGLLPWPLLLLLCGKRGIAGLTSSLRHSPSARALLLASLLPPVAASLIPPTGATWVLSALPPAAIVLAIGIRAGLTGAVRFRLRLALLVAAPALATALLVAGAIASPSVFDPVVGVSAALAVIVAIVFVATRTARRLA